MSDVSVNSRVAPADAIPASRAVRLSVEQASYAYSIDKESAPLFTLEATSVQARRRELVAIVGPNASGKSTLLRLISGALKPLSGRVQLDGFEVSTLDARTRAQRIAVVQQESPLLFPIRVGEYALQGRHPYGQALHFETSQDLEIAESALAQVGVAHLRARWMHQLSGGEKQKVVLARALAQQPLLLLLDEPTLHLDIGAQVDLLQQLRRLAENHGYTIVVVTHELNLAAEFADQVALLHHGKCLSCGTAAEVYRREVLEKVFGASLEITPGPTGRPRVTPYARREEFGS